MIRLALPSLLCALSLLACGRATPRPSTPEYDAAFSVAANGTIDQGLIVATSNDPATMQAEIKSQLWYVVGQLNGHNGVTDMARLQTTVTSATRRMDGRYDVQYTAKLFVSWPREANLSTPLPLVLPVGGDDASLSAFYANYGSDQAGDKLCMDDAAHDVTQSIFWYYYRPFKGTCSLRGNDPEDSPFVRRTTLHLERSDENTSGKFPEYGKVWEDGKLVVTAVFGKYEVGATALDDGGIAAFRQTYFDLLSRYGHPTSTNLPAGVEPNAANDDVRLVFRTASGPLDVHLYLVDELQSVGAPFKEKYNERTKTSDFVSYSGHSGLGANIRALAKMGQFVKGQYQIFMVNGCDTFAYVDNALRDAHQLVNPGEGPDRFIDLITNSMPSYFNKNAQSNLAVIDALVGKRLTYREILGQFDVSQRPAVTGEEDNRWPLPF